MARTPSSRWTVKDVLSMVRELTKTVDQQKILSDQGKFFYNASLSEIVSLLNSTTDPSYLHTEPFSLGTGQAFLHGDATQDATQVLSSTTTTLVAYASGNWAIGQYLAITVVADGGTIYMWTAKVTAVSGDGKTATFQVLSGSASAFNFTGGQYWAGIVIYNSFSTSSYDTANLAYQYDRIISIWDTNCGECVEVTVPTFYSIGRADFPHKSYDSDIVWTMIGNTIMFRTGTKVTAGSKTMIYQRQPIYPTLYDDTEYADISDKFIALLVKRMYTYILLQQESDIPKNLAQEMVSDYQQISAYAGAEIQNRIKNRKQVEQQ